MFQHPMSKPPFLNRTSHLNKFFIAQGHKDLDVIKSKSGVEYPVKINDFYIDRVTSITLYDKNNEEVLHWEMTEEVTE